MKLIQKNIWLAFYIIISIGLVSLTVTLYTVKKDLQSDVQLEQENIVKVASNSIESLLHQYEVMLDILGKELIVNNNYLNPEYSLRLINNLTEVNKSITSIALTKPNGEIYLLESKNRKKVSQAPNLLEDAMSKASFSKALKSENIVIGRTYYTDVLKKLIIPIRKAIRNKEGKIMFVASLVIGMDEGYRFFIDSGEQGADYNIFIYRESDRYFQIAPKQSYQDPAIYNYQVPLDLVQKDIRTVEQKYNLSYEEIKERQLITQYEKHDLTPPSLLTSIYLKEYDLWVVEKTSLAKVSSAFVNTTLLLSAAFFVIASLIFWLFRIIDKSENRKKNELHFQATHDYLTKLPNRFYLRQKFLKPDPNKPFSLFFVDMDNFKTINDSYGHNYGDKVLIEISRRLSLIKNEDDTIVRYSGDEFIFIVNNANKEEIEIIASKILSELSKPYVVYKNTFHLSASIGIASFPQNATTLDEVKRYADLALYKSKEQKNSYTFFNESIKSEYLEHLNLENQIKHAFENDEFYMVYQPQLCNNENICGLEALVRWENKEVGFIGPDVFIPIAESSGQMIKLGNFVIQKSLSEVKKMEEELGIDVPLSINISVKQFMDEGFVEHLLHCIEKYAFNKNKLQLEITESVFIEDIDYIINILNQLRKEGIKVSLDDFGTGFSSLSLLNKLPIDELKIDKSFVDAMLQSESSKTMVESIIAIAKKMNMYLVAEGIEEANQKELLQSMGCDLYQGYYFSKPLKVDGLKSYIQTLTTDE